MNNVLTPWRFLISFCAGSAAVLWLWPVGARAAPPAEACGLLTQQEASSALGFALGPPDKALKTVCTWQEPGQPLGKDLQVSYLSETIYQAGKQMGGATITSESGLGDEAYLIDQHGILRLDVKKGGTYFRVFARITEFGKGISAEEQKKTVEIERSVARIILGRI
jgi:hypothetical protein